MACTPDVITSSKLAPNSAETWQLFQFKHLEGPVPDTPTVSTDPIKLPNDFNIMAILRSFPKLTAAGPSGMHVQHLLDAVNIPLPTSSLHHLVNLLAAAKAPSQLSIYLAAGNLTALSKNKSNNNPDVRPIIVGEVLRRLTSKCICSLIKTRPETSFNLCSLGWPAQLVPRNSWTTS